MPFWPFTTPSLQQKTPRPLSAQPTTSKRCRVHFDTPPPPHPASTPPSSLLAHFYHRPQYLPHPAPRPPTNHPLHPLCQIHSPRACPTHARRTAAPAAACENSARKQESGTTGNEDNQPVLRGGGTLINNVYRSLHSAAGFDEDEESRWSEVDNSDNALWSWLDASGGTWLPLHGYQCIVWFDPCNIDTFVDAVDRLLGLDNRAGVPYTLYLLDKDRVYTAEERRKMLESETLGVGNTVWCRGPGDFSYDVRALEWLNARILTSDLNEISAMEKKIFFVAGPADPFPWVWEPMAHHNAMKVMLNWVDDPRSDRPDIAYLRMPVYSRDYVYTNQFNPWMARSSHHHVRGETPASRRTNAYGGLAFLSQHWNKITAQWSRSKDKPVSLTARTRKEHKKDLQGCDRFHIFFAGAGAPYDNHYLLHSEIGDIFTMAALEVYLPGETFLQAEGKPDCLMPVPEKVEDLEVSFRPLINHMLKMKQLLLSKPVIEPLKNGLQMFPQFITFRPIFTEYTMCDMLGVTEPVTWSPDSTDVAEFRRLAEWVWSRGKHRRVYMATSNIEIVQGRPKFISQKKDDARLDSKPKFLITPETSEEEWKWIRKLIIEPEIYINVMNKSNVLPFGYRDIYKTPKELLYPGLSQDSWPTTTRHYDRQSHGEDVNEKLKTLQPGDKQPLQWNAHGHPLLLPCIPPQPKPEQRRHHALPVRMAITARSAMLNPQISVCHINHDITSDKLREHSYANPLDVQMGLSVPINAPPIDSLLNLGHHSTPFVSLSILTPTEVRRLQRDHYDMRNQALSRTERCPYPGCGSVFPANNPTAMQQHLSETHQGETRQSEKCNFCDDKLYLHWTPAQRAEHFSTKQMDLLVSLGGKPPGSKRADAKQAQSVAPETTQQIAASQGPEPVSPGTRNHEHDEAEEDERSFCEGCSLPLGPFPENYREKHLEVCKDHGRDNARFCPWCGDKLIRDLNRRIKHLATCADKPKDDPEGPIDMKTRKYFPKGSATVEETSTGIESLKKRSRADANVDHSPPKRSNNPTKPGTTRRTKRVPDVPAVDDDSGTYKLSADAVSPTDAEAEPSPEEVAREFEEATTVAGAKAVRPPRLPYRAQRRLLPPPRPRWLWPLFVLAAAPKVVG
ncbi:hypothetical protein N0V88_005508 [Collariella sp. IMI 366227]|nr:hypothetical protein N0V88_005508 [Collariella sp. IMI 366227]